MNLIFSAENYPIFQNVVYNTIEEAQTCKTTNIEIIQDEKTGLIYNHKFNPSIINYNETYNNEQQFSEIFRKHLLYICEIIVKYFYDKNILEIGCGDGYFLELLEKNNFNIHGIDPSYKGKNPNIKKEYHNNDKNKYNAFIMRHVLEHINDPYNFLLTLKNNSDKNSLIYIEVPDLEYINDNCVFFDLFYEHVNYFRIEDFQNMFDNILYLKKTFGKQYISLVAELNSLKKPIKKTNFALNKMFFNKLNDYINLIKYNKSKKVIWGCSSKGVIFSILLNNNNTKVDYFVDINPYKQNKYIPLISTNDGYGKIEKFEQIKKYLNKDSIIFIMNPNYKEEIIEMTNNKYIYKVL